MLCGAIAAYNETELPPGPSNYVNLIPRRGRMEGFIILDYVSRFPEAQGEILTWLLEGKLNHDEHVVECQRLLDPGGAMFVGDVKRHGVWAFPRP